MMISQGLLAALVSLALVACAVSPVVLLVLFVREWNKEDLW